MLRSQRKHRPTREEGTYIPAKDTSNQRKLEGDLQESRRIFRILMETVFEGIVIHESGTIILANQAFATMFGYDAKDIIGMKAKELIAPESRSIFANNACDILVKPREIIGIRKDKRKFPVEIVNKRCTYEGRQVGMVAARATTERELLSALAAANQELAHLSITDGLTLLYNHRHFHTCLNHELERSSRTGLPISLLMLDIDHFKKLNDAFGHLAGDAVLHRLGQILLEESRMNDVVSRYGGEEFAVILVDTSKEFAVGVAERLRRRIAHESFVCDDYRLPYRVTVSIGVSSCPEDAIHAQGLIEAADTALYAAKRIGRNRVETADERISS